MAWNRLILRMGFYQRFSCRFALRDLITVDDLIPIAPICTVLSGSPRGPRPPSPVHGNTHGVALELQHGVSFTIMNSVVNYGTLREVRAMSDMSPAAAYDRPASKRVTLDVVRPMTVSMSSLLVLDAVDRGLGGGEGGLSLQTLADLMGCVRSTASRRIALCEEEGLIAVRERVAESGVYLPSGYKILEVGRATLEAARREGLV